MLVKICGRNGLIQRIAFSEKVEYFQSLQLQKIAGSAAGASIAPHLQCLRKFGFCKPESGFAVRYWVTMSTVTFYIVLQLIYANQVLNDMERLSQVLFVMMCHLTSTAKQLVFYLSAASIDRLVHSLEDKVFNQDTTRAQRLLADTARRSVLLQRWFSTSAVVTVCLWPILPAVDRLRGRPGILPIWVPFHYHHPLLYITVHGFSLFATFLVAVGNTTMDAFVAAIFDQCKTQLRILRMNFENLIEDADLVAKNTRRKYEEVLHESFINCVIHYRKITECCRLLQTTFGPALLLLFTVAGWMLCMAAYTLVSVEFNVDFVSTTMFLICILIELLLYCYHGNEVTVESDRVVQSVYNMQWTNTSVSFRRSMVILMSCAQQPLQPAAGSVVPLSLKTYVTIIKSSYSFYAVLRQTK